MGAFFALVERKKPGRDRTVVDIHEFRSVKDRDAWVKGKDKRVAIDGRTTEGARMIFDHITAHRDEAKARRAAAAEHRSKSEA